MSKKLEQRYGHMAPPHWDDHGFRCGFVEADRHEPAHVHVEYRESNAKFWLDKPPPECVRFAGAPPPNKGDRTKMLAYVKRNREDLLKKWQVYFGRR